MSFTHLQFSGDEGKKTEAWIPRNTVNARFSSRLSSIPELKYGISGRWYSNAKGDNADQDAYFVLDAFTSYDLDADTSIRLNINNLLNEKYIQGLGSGAIYGAPRNGLVTLTYNF